jgi:hypothetical protein
VSEILVQAFGVLLVLAALVDVLLTVLYSRSDIPFIGQWLGQLIWNVGRTAFLPLGAIGDRLTTFLGPIILVAVVAQWILLLIVGFALVFWPGVGQAITGTGPVSPDHGFGTALYYSGYTLTTLGYGDIVPRTLGYRIVTIVEAATGFSVFTLVITYLLSVLTALRRRNAFALSLHHASGGTDDAAELIARLAAGGSYTAARQRLSGFSAQLDDLFESHQSYPVLHYFYFSEPFLEMANIAGILADAGALARSALKEDEARSLVRSAEVGEVIDSAHYLLRRLGPIYLPRKYHPSPQGPSEQERGKWRGRFRAAYRCLREQGLPVVDDPEAAAQLYVEQRARWQPWVNGFHGFMGHRQQAPGA